MEEAVTKVIDTLTQEDFHGTFQKLLERYNKCIKAVGDYFERNKSFMCVLSIKVPIRKTSGNLFNVPRIYEKLATLVEGDPKAPFSIATTLKCCGGRVSIPEIAQLYSWSLLYNAEC